MSTYFCDNVLYWSINWSTNQSYWLDRQDRKWFLSIAEVAMGLEKKRLYQAVAQAIVDGVRSGEFPAGARLPGERDLAARFNVSRVTIREAEIALESLGYITIKTGSGVYVRKDKAGINQALPDVSAFELTTARSVIEAEAAALAAVNISDAEIGELHFLIGEMAR
ncbi:MAG: FadR/GntR family transcriptional regulator, partial [Gammaproteobacteria bacterium]